MTFLVSNYSLAERYYGEFLGFEKAFTYNSPLGMVVSYKVNDRQFIEFIEDKQAKEKDRLVAVSFETENAEQMRLFLASKGVTVPEKITLDGAGNRVFLVHDPAGVPVEFLEWGPKSLHRASKGKFLSPNRISNRIHHAGLYSEKLVDNPLFYTEILGFKTILRVPEDLLQPPQILYFQIAGTAEFIEHYPTDTRAFSHPCFVATDMQEVIYTLKERRKDEKLAAPMVGKGRRWLLNIYNSDGTRVEFTEMFLAK
jgi:catechol 2,3-dioxygenase-like lactoylglutathione lyase family enzyme